MKNDTEKDGLDIWEDSSDTSRDDSSHAQFTVNVSLEDIESQQIIRGYLADYMASISSKLASTQDPDFNSRPIRLLNDLIGYFGILSLAAFVGYGSIWGAAEIGTDIALSHGASQSMANMIGVITGSCSFIATTCVNAYYVEKAINRILTKVPYKEPYKGIYWLAALIATIPNTILSLKEIPNVYLDILMGIVDTIAGAGLQLEGVMGLVREIKELRTKPDDNKEVLIKIITALHDNMKNWTKEQKKGFAKEVIKRAESMDMDNVIDAFVTEIQRQSLDLERGGVQLSRVLKFVEMLWMCTGVLATFGNPQAAADSFAKMGVKIGFGIAAGIGSIPNAALVSIANKNLYPRLFNIPEWYANTTKSEQNWDVGILAVSLIISGIASANAMGIAHNALSKWGAPLLLDKILTIAAGVSTLGINISSTEVMIHRLIDALQNKTDGLDQAMLGLIEIFKRMPSEHSTELLSDNAQLNNYARFFPPEASAELRRRHSATTENTPLVSTVSTMDYY